MEMKGTIIFTTVTRFHYGFDVFSVKIPSDLTNPISSSEHRHTDGVSINFNAQFVDDHRSIVFVSERAGSPRIYLARPGSHTPELLPSAADGLFHDRPIIKDGRLYYLSAHEPSDRPFKSWCALYSTALDGDKKIVRVTPDGHADFSPAISQSGKYMAVASFGSRLWDGDFRDLHSDIVVFPVANPTRRVVVCQHGGWPTWSGDSSIYFHRQSEDGWWSIYRLDLPEHFSVSGMQTVPLRVTPSGLHAFTPAAFNDGNRIAIATRRRDRKFRHVEIFDLRSQEFHPLSELLNPDFHHYNPFISPDSGFVGYHRFRGESGPGELVAPYLDYVESPIEGVRMFRVKGNFPVFSPSGDLIAYNPDLDSQFQSGLHIVKSDGSKRWRLLKGQMGFYNAWSPTEENVIYTSLGGPVFGSPQANVQVARISFNLADLDGDREEIPVDVKVLTRVETGNNAFPSISPDGKFVVFRSGRSGHKNLYIMDAVDGEFNGGVRRLTDGQWIDTMPSWSPDGKLIAFSSNMHNPDNPECFSIYLIKPDGTGLHRVRVEGWTEEEANRERINHVVFAGEGSEWLLFAGNMAAVTGEAVSIPHQFQPYGDLFAVKVDGTGFCRLTWNGYENGTPAWHPRLLEPSNHGDQLKGEFEEPRWITCDF